MRLRLVHALSLLLVAMALIAVTAMGVFTAVNLRQGFGDYLVSRDVERLERFAAMLQTKLSAGSTIEDWRGPPPSMRPLLDEFRDRVEGESPGDRRRAPRRPDHDDPPPDDGPPAAAGGNRPGGRPGGPWEARREAPPPPGPPDNFGPRVSVLDAAGELVAGRPTPAADAVATRPLVVAGQTLGYVRLRRGPPVSDAVDARFLRRQYRDLLLVGAALLVFAFGAAWWIARRWVRPLLEVQQASARIARGEFGIRLEERGSTEIAATVRNLNAMAASLSRLEGARRRWLADVSHELRTPLTVLRGEVEALADGVRAPTPAALASLREETLQLGRLIDDLHLVAMSDLDALRCDFVAVDAGELLREALRRFGSRAAERGIALELELADDPLPVHWDVARIGQLCANLLENALRYTDTPGRVRARLRLETGRVPADGGSLVCLSIDDTPPGVTDEQLESLFEPLYRTDAARSRTAGGSGLGLAICAAIVRAHGGRIAARRSELGGLGIDVWLPRRVESRT